MKKRNNILLGVVVLLVVAAATLGIILKNKGAISEREAASEAENFVNTYLMQPGTKASISEVSKEYDLYKVKINIGGGQVVDSYLSRDGKLFFPQALDIQQIKSEGNNSGLDATDPSASIPQDVPKSAKPKVELFVMSYCPFGLQMQKGLFPVIDTLGNKIDFELKFNDYLMHGEKELKENLVQHCIQKDQKDKLSAYVTCFAKSGDTDACMTSTGIDKAKNSACAAATDKEFKITENMNANVDYHGSYPGFNVYKNDNQQYGVGGSPTLIINGVEVQAARDSASLLRTICAAFEDAPAECQTELPSTTPSSGIGAGTAPATVAAANCE